MGSTIQSAVHKLVRHLFSVTWAPCLLSQLSHLDLSCSSNTTIVQAGAKATVLAILAEAALLAVLAYGTV